MSVATLPQLCCAIGPDLTQSCAGLAEPGKHPCHNKLVENLRPILLKAISSVTGDHFAHAHLVPNLAMKIAPCRFLLACLHPFEKQ